MRVNHWLIGCAICFASVGTAAATTADSRELDNSLHANGDSSAHDGGNSSENGLPHDGAPRNTSSDSHKGTSSNSSDHSGSDITPPARAQQSHLGWQSLLPGSIQ